MTELRVPKRRVPAELGLPDGTTRSVALFLAELAHDHAGAERVSDILNGGADFIPALDTTRDQVVFFNRAGITYAQVDATEERDPSDDLTLPTEFHVELTFLHGGTLRGLVSYILPPDRARLVDYLNAQPPFFRLLHQERVSLVNKKHIAQLSPID